jgi:peroxidase
MLQPGTKVMILPHVKDEELPKLFPKGVDKVSMPSGKVYVRTTTDY